MFQRNAVAQDYSYVQYTVQNGLAGSTVYNVVQDRDGFVWFATETGLSRFDGTRFKNYTSKDGLPDDEIVNLFVDSRNRLWVMPFKNAICYISNGKLFTQQNDTTLGKLKITTDVLSVSEDNRGDILILEAKAAHVISSNQQVSNIYSIENPADSLFPVFACKNPVAGFTVGLNRRHTFTLFNLNNNRISPIKKVYAPTNGVYRKGMLSMNWEIFKNNNWFDIHSTIHKTSYRIKAPPDFLGFTELNDSVFFFNTLNGTFAYNYLSEHPVKSFLHQHQVSAVLLDAEGSFWFTTLDEGVFKLVNPELTSLLIRGDEKKNTPVYCLEASGDKLYIGSNNGLFYTLDKNSKQLDSTAVKYSKGRILSIKPDSAKKQIFLGTDNGILKIDEHRVERLIHADAIKSIQRLDSGWLVSANYCVFFLEDKNTSAGKNIITYKNTLIERYLKLADKNKVWSGRATNAFRQGQTSYIGTLNGLYEIRPGAGAIYLGDKIPAFRNRVNDIKASPDGTLWVATNGGGVAGYKNGQLRYQVDAASGLSSNACRTVFCTDKAIWVGTDKGINKLTISGTDIHISKYTVNDGLPSDIINAIYTERDKVYAGTSRGLAFFDETRLPARSICNLKMLNITVGKKVLPDSISGLALNKHDNISFEFAGISLKSAGEITYQHRLIGLDTGWIAGRQNTLEYLSLPPGNFTFEVFATNKFGVKSNLLSVPFRINRPFIETAWVQVPVTLLVITGIWLFMLYRLKKEKKASEEKTRINNRVMELEQMALRSQMNPHFIFNSLNSIQQYVIDKDISGANKYITSFSRLIRQTLDNSSREKISIKDELSYLSTYLELEKTRMENMFNYSIEYSAALAENDIFIPPMLLQPYIENSIRHGVRYRNDNAGKINITIGVDGVNLMCTITDNGIGRKQSQLYKGSRIIEYQSRGMSLTEERIKLINASNTKNIRVIIEDLEDAQQMPAGTRVIISFPIEIN